MEHFEIDRVTMEWQCLGAFAIHNVHLHLVYKQMMMSLTLCDTHWQHELDQFCETVIIHGDLQFDKITALILLHNQWPSSV
jgi:hypothetical protein